MSAASEMSARCAGVTWRPEASISFASLSHSADAAGDRCVGFCGVPKVGGVLLFLGLAMLSFIFNNLRKFFGKQQYF